MNNLKINNQLGTKWFIFFTKVRPWIYCIVGLQTIKDFVGNTQMYLGNWWLMLYFVADICLMMLEAMVFVKSKGDYIDFVSFVDGVLIFETITLSYQYGVNQYIQSGYEIAPAIIGAMIMLLISYFAWYCLNMKYFRKRIVGKNFTHYTCSNEEKYISNQENSNGEEVIITDKNIETVEVDFHDLKNIKKAKVRFCKFCGAQIDAQTKQCGGCGKQYFKGIKFNKFSITILILSLVIISSIILNIVQIVEINELNKDNEYYNNKLLEKQTQILKLNKEIAEKEEDLKCYKSYYERDTTYTGIEKVFRLYGID